MPWSTGFEDGFCDYTKFAGYCYGDQPWVLVTEPRHSGRFAAEFKVKGGSENQTRCVRQGVLPESAYYGAWYFIPEALKETERAWNLWHFQRADRPAPPYTPLWDVTLVPKGGAASGDWELVVYDQVVQPATTYRSAEPKAVPIGRWFHIELFLKRASDATGEIRLYQDGAPLFERAALKSDASRFTQWYVGDWAEKATPADSHLYVDDVSISATLSATQ
ncbi:MAG TPA: heparin lyase I family protein [Polyangiaceae bacterium]|nr:heparin lyase I family protein [Polyangiaceae bacterium]